MSTTRSVEAAAAGPAQIWADLAAHGLTVTADPACTRAVLTISTDDNTGPSADRVRAAELHENGLEIGIRLAAGAGGMVMGSGGGGSVTVGVNYGVIAGTIVNGTIVNGTTPASRPILIQARVPAGSSVRFEATSGGLTTNGPLRAVQASVLHGEIDVEVAAQVEAKTTSGDIRILELVDAARLESVSGSIFVAGGPAARAQARSISGDVRGRGGILLDGSSLSGRVRTR